MVEMLKEVQFAVCIVLCFGVSFSTKATAPNWNALTYTVEGTLQLPYAEITEPFSAYYDAKNNKSRIDYYGGMVITIQRSDMTKFGVSYKLAPMSTEKQLNMDMCFQVNGTNNDDAVTIQSILPDLTGFDMIGVEMKSGNNCTKWQKVDVQGKKKNVYTMWVGPDGKMPVRYEMHGYDSLLGSHYDKYYLDYINFGTNNIDSKKFDPPTNMTCGGFPGPGIKEHRIMMNPMREYINNDQTHIDQMFGFYKNQHSKQYPSVEEHEQRKHIFRHNVRYIHSKNRAGLTYRLAVNHLADKSSEELKLMRGFRYTPGNHGGLPFQRSKYNLKDVPANLDWRLYGAVNPVKDQAVCGSCWSFGTTGTIEGAYFLKTGNLVRLSQQELMDCSWGEGNNACDGGEDFRAYQYIMKNGGLTTEEQYGGYLGQDGQCRKDKVTPIAKLKNYVNITQYDQQALTFAIAHMGPVSVGIDASHLSLSFYANGVYYEPKCGNKPDDLDHAVLAVGYGTMNGQAYWLIKNSWSTYWGMDGYVLMSQKDNNCGVATDATYVVIE